MHSRFGISTCVNLPENLTEFLHFLIRSESHAQHLVQRRKWPTYCHTATKHFLSERAHITADVNHYEISVRFDVTNVLLVQPVAQLAAYSYEFRSPGWNQGIAIPERRHRPSQGENRNDIVHEWFHCADQIWSSAAKSRASPRHAVNLRKSTRDNHILVFAHVLQGAFDFGRLRKVNVGFIYQQHGVRWQVHNQPLNIAFRSERRCWVVWIT